MNRPASIVTFERCYIGAWAVGLVNTLLAWRITSAMIASDPRVAQLGAKFGPGLMLVSLVIGTLITFLLWYFVARKASVVAKWIVIVFFALGLVSFLAGLASGNAAASSLGLILAVIVLVLQAVAVWMLFRADARDWFDEEPAEPVV